MMKTIDCSTLEMLIENHEPIELIDVRSRNEFATIHIPGARSFPLAELSKPKLFLRDCPTAERVYVVSDGRASASMAAGILRSGGWLDPVVVDGGMRAWIAHGFPVRRMFLLKMPVFLYAGALLSGIAAVLGVRNIRNFAWPEVLVAGLLLIVAGALVLKANFFAGLGIETKSAQRQRPAHTRLPWPHEHNENVIAMLRHAVSDNLLFWLRLRAY